MKNPHVLPGFQMVSTPNQLAIQDQRRRNIAKKEATEKEAPFSTGFLLHLPVLDGVFLGVPYHNQLGFFGSI